MRVAAPALTGRVGPPEHRRVRETVRPGVRTALGVGRWVLSSALLLGCAAQAAPTGSERSARRPAAPLVVAPEPAVAPPGAALSTAASSAGPSVFTPPAAPARLDVLLRRRSRSRDEVLELLKALGLDETFKGVEPGDIKLETALADVDEQPGDERIVFVDGSAVWRVSAVVVLASAAGRTVVLHRHDAVDGPDLLGLPTIRSTTLVAGPSPGKQLLLESLLEHHHADGVSGPMGESVTESWRVSSIRAGALVLHLDVQVERRGALGDFDPLELSRWRIESQGGKLVRLDPDDKVVESWRWDAVNQRYVGTGPNGAWWRKQRAPAPKRRE